MHQITLAYDAGISERAVQRDERVSDDTVASIAKALKLESDALTRPDRHYFQEEIKRMASRYRMIEAKQLLTMRDCRRPDRLSRTDPRHLLGGGRGSGSCPGVFLITCVIGGTSSTSCHTRKNTTPSNCLTEETLTRWSLSYVQYQLTGSAFEELPRTSYFRLPQWIFG